MNECDICYGDIVQLFDSNIGTVRYIGELSYGDPSHGRNKNGMFYGISLKSKKGQHNGSIRGRVYFQCAPRNGIFIRLRDIDTIIKKSKHSSNRYHINQLIYIKNKSQVGTIKYIGLCPHLDTQYDNGSLWFGIELTSDDSRNKYQTSGTIQNMVYFKSSRGCNAMFIQASNISHIPQDILAKIAAETPPALELKTMTNHKKKKKNNKDDRRSSVFELLRLKLTSAMSSKHTNDGQHANHIKSASASVKLSNHTKPITLSKPSTTTRQSRSQSTPRNPALIIACANGGIDMAPIHLPNSVQHKDKERNIPYRKQKQKQNKHVEKEKTKTKRLNKHHKIRHQAKLTPTSRVKPKRSARSMQFGNTKTMLQRSQSSDPKPKIKHKGKGGGHREHKEHKQNRKHREHKDRKERERERERKGKRRKKVSLRRNSHNNDEIEGNPSTHRPRPRKQHIPRPKTPQAPKRAPISMRMPKRRKGSKPPPPKLSYSQSTHTLPNEVSLRSQSAKAPSIYKARQKSQDNEAQAQAQSQSPPEGYRAMSPRHLSPRSWTFQNGNNGNLPALAQASSYDSSSTSSAMSSPKQYLGSISPRVHQHGRIVEQSHPSDKNDKRKSSMKERAKLMMNALPFSMSSDLNQQGSDANVEDYRRGHGKNDSDSGSKVKKANPRSRTRDIGEMIRSLRNENEKSPRKHKKEKGKQRVSYGTALDISGSHQHQRSKSLEINLEDLLKRGSDDSDSKEMEEYIFTSSSDHGTDAESDDFKDSDYDDSDYSSDDHDDTLSLWVGTWNVGESDFICDDSMLRGWIGSSRMHRMHDMYVVGLQECVSQHRKNWMAGILGYLDSEHKQYTVISKLHLMNILLIVIINKLYVHRVRDIRCKTVACGKGNIIGNKGGVAITFQFDETSFALINVHLVARAERFVQRMENIERIFKNMDSAAMGTFDRIDCLNQFEHVIFFGDLNYRIMKDFWSVCDLIKRREYGKFVQFDQLKHQMETAEILYNFAEGDISAFAPTYRWERDRNIISNKREQAPSYTDRILYKSLPECYSLWQTKYKSCMNCFGSDHRPIMSIFRFVPRSLPRQRQHKRRARKFKNIEISFYEIRAYIDTRKTKNGLEITDKICCTLYYKYSTNDETSHDDKLDGGAYDKKQQCWCWNLNVLDQLKIQPYILNPDFLIETHVYLKIVNVSKYNSIIGYSVIPLFYVFPKSLVDREKIKRKYNPTATATHTTATEDNRDTTQNDRNNNRRKRRRQRLNDKEFNSPITIHGTYCGDIKGFIHAHSDFVEKHRKITTKQKYK